ncbi:DUF5713 family protein [Streptomyces litmocidini]|uniref:DUF5713 family protein n=1 Tax=Streptomyces litmocidini TaxID=67318 RepID=UPI003405CDD7
MVDQGKAILLRLDERTEAEWQSNEGAWYASIQTAVEEFKLLDRQFEAAGNGIETVAREWICDEFCFAVAAYGFTDADAQELAAGRRW